MVEKKQSQAEKAAAAKKTKSAGSGKAKKNTVKAAPVKETVKAKEQTVKVPVRLITSLICLASFLLLFFAFLKPDGVVLWFVGTLVQSAVGQVAFYVSIPAVLYLFVIHAFSGKRPVVLRTVCLLSFVAICGCISQIAMMMAEDYVLPEGMELISALTLGGTTGESAGLLCGGLAMLLNWLFREELSLIILVIAALLTLLGSFQITVPSIIRAIQNRPRAEWES